MFDSLRRHQAQDRTASDRLQELVAAAPPPPKSTDETKEWIDETPPSPLAKPRIATVLGRIPARRLPIVLGAAVFAAICAVVGLLLSRPMKESPPPLPAAVVQDHKPTATQTIVVSVVGRVPSPGLFTLPDGARVADAVHAAGGASTEDLIALNMARRLADGEQVYVGVPAPPEPAAPAAKPGKIDLNSADASQLDNLPGVGAVTAQRIIEWRGQHGRFTAVEQLRQVDGIGESRFARLKDLVTVH
ncbi:ComEA family DNA-binding protein [Actinocrispum sp. NPDC049592]|uniref:ComEA family DNA-binding protein n=1 Tax=Actinocrispum sp. NPDC049592 TaxID=3154835 RepID=UPI00341561BD